MSAFYRNSRWTRRIAIVTLILTFNSLTGVNSWALGLIEQHRELNAEIMELIDGSQGGQGVAIEAENALDCANKFPNNCNSSSASNIAFEHWWGTVASFNQVDLSIPLSGDFSLDLVRTYFGRREKVYPYEYQNILGNRMWSLNIDKTLYSAGSDILLDHADMQNAFFRLSGESTKFVSRTNVGQYWTMLKDTTSNTKYQIKKEDGTLLQFDDDGYLWFEWDRNGNEIQYHRDPSYQRATKITGPGAEITLEYDYFNGRVLTKVNAPNNLSIVYEYDTAYSGYNLIRNNLTKVSWKDGATELRSESYMYSSVVGDDLYVMTKVLRNGQVYRTMNRVGSGETIDAIHNSTGQTKIKAYAGGAATITKYFSSSNSKQEGWYSNGAHDATEVNNYYDALNYYKKNVDHVGGAFDLNGRQVTKIRDNANNAINTLAYTFQTATPTYDNHRSLRNLTKQTDVFGNNTTYLYETTYNNVTKATNPDGSYSELFYNGYGNLTKSVSRANGGAELYEVNYEVNSAGLVTKEIKDPGGLDYTTTYLYNGMGQVTKVEDGCGCQAGSREMMYDGLGRMTKADSGAAGNASEFYYDKLGNQTKVVAPIGATGSPTWIESRFHYDNNGQLTKLQAPYLLNDLVTNGDFSGGSSGWTLSGDVSISGGVGTAVSSGGYFEQTISGLEAGTSYTFSIDINPQDSYELAVYLGGSLVDYQITSFGGTYTAVYFAGSGNSNLKFELSYLSGAVVVDNVKLYKKGPDSYNYYDTEGRLTKSQNAASGTITYQYDYWDNLTKLTDPLGQATAYEYDLLERLTKESDAAGNSATFEYDANNNVTKMVNPNAAATTFQYNNGDMLTKIDRPGSELDVTYLYDLTKRQLTKIEESGTGADAITYDYDDAGRMTKEAYANAATNIQYSHNAYGQPTTLSRPHGQGDVTYLYDDMAQLTKVDSASGDAAYEHDDKLRVTKTAYDNYTDASSYYDAGGRLTKLVNNFDTASYTQAYDYDHAGNRTKTTLSGSLSGTVSYSYDDTFQLTRETRSGTSNNYDHQYWFDAAGNRTKQDKGGSATTFLYNNVNQLTKSTAAAVWEYSYDDNGNLTKKYKDANNQTAYYWDSRNLMTKVTVTTGGSPTDHTFAYDALGRRRSMTSGGTTTEYLYEGLKVLVEKTGGLTKRYTNGPQAVGGIISKDDGSDTTYYHYDAIGNVLLTSDGDGYVDATFVQDAFGNVIAGTASGYHLTTKEYFPAFGLYYFNARWYDPEIGRFVSREPLKIDGPNFYCFVVNNPVSKIDLNGLWWMDEVEVVRDIGVDTAANAWGLACGIAIANDTNNLFRVYGISDRRGNGSSNALFHCTIACRIQRNCGDRGSKWWNNRERGANGRNTDQMDLNNNRVGQKLCPISPDRCEDLCLDALENDQLTCYDRLTGLYTCEH